MDSTTFFAVRRAALLDGCKWDPQVGDVSILAPFPIILRRSVWNQLAAWAGQLSAETLAAEREILQRPELLNDLGLPRALRSVLASEEPLTRAAARVMRFDFHPTSDGWKISEVNSDVPGGFTESTSFTLSVARHFPMLEPTGLPAFVWADAIAAAMGPHDGQGPGQGPAVVVLLAAPGYLEDLQIVSYLGHQLHERGCGALLAHPSQIQWIDGWAHLPAFHRAQPINALVRFYQAEWLARLAPSTGWRHFFRGGKTPVVNPGAAIISESKRFPLAWDRLRTPLPCWRMLLPESRPPREAPWTRDDRWIVKTALSNTGDDVSIRPLLNRREWLGVRAAVAFQPGRWVAQRRFESIPKMTPAGERHLCVGVYTINGNVAGAYARLASRPLIDYAAVDAALLVEKDP